MSKKYLTIPVCVLDKETLSHQYSSLGAVCFVLNPCTSTSLKGIMLNIHFIFRYRQDKPWHTTGQLFHQNQWKC